MESNWATEELQVIRTLMERSALYRRTLAPIMLFLGVLGIAAAVIGARSRGYDKMPHFGTLWLVTAAVAVIGAFLISRRQALKQKEPFWSPPTRRVAQAVTPPLLAGMIVGLVATFFGGGEVYRLVWLWVLLYGCALHAAGFCVPRGMRTFAWFYVAAACVMVTVFTLIPESTVRNMNWLMGFFFGVLQLVYGVGLYFTEKEKNAA